MLSRMPKNFKLSRLWTKSFQDSQNSNENSGETENENKEEEEVLPVISPRKVKTALTTLEGCDKLKNDISRMSKESLLRAIREMDAVYLRQSRLDMYGREANKKISGARCIDYFTSDALKLIGRTAVVESENKLLKAKINKFRNTSQQRFRNKRAVAGKDPHRRNEWEHRCPLEIPSETQDQDSVTVKENEDSVNDTRSTCIRSYLDDVKPEKTRTAKRYRKKTHRQSRKCQKKNKKYIRKGEEGLVCPCALTKDEIKGKKLTEEDWDYERDLYAKKTKTKKSKESKGVVFAGLLSRIFYSIMFCGEDSRVACPEVEENKCAAWDYCHNT